MNQEPPRRFYVFYFDDTLEGEHALARALEYGVPHRLQKFYSTAYAGAISLGRGWGRLYVPEACLHEFMEATDNRLAPEPELYVDGGAGSPPSLNFLQRLKARWRSTI